MKKVLVTLFLLFVSISVYSADINMPVTARINGERFYTACDYLSKQTGFDISAGRQAADWNVYDRHIFISVENVPLRTLLDTICRVMNFSYSVNNNTIIFEQSPEQLKQEAELVLKQVALDKEEQANKKAKGAEQIRKHAASLDDTRASCPYGYLLNTTSFGKAVVRILDDPIIGSAVIDNNTSKYVLSELPEDSQNFVRELAKAYKELDPEIDLNILDGNNKLILIINRPTPDENNIIDTETVLSRITIMTASDGVDAANISASDISRVVGKIEINLLYPENRYSNIVANAILDIKAGKNNKDIAAAMEEQIKFVSNDYDGKKIDLGELADPIFSKKVDLYGELKKKNVSINEILMVASVRAGINMVADCFYRNSINIASGAKSFADIIMNVSMNYKLEHGYQDNILTLRDKHWYLLRAGEIASDWLDYWEECAIIQKGYSLNVLIEMAALTDLQIDYELSLNPQLNKNTDFAKNETKGQVIINTKEVKNKRDILRFLGSMNEEQKKIFFAVKAETLDLLSKNADTAVDKEQLMLEGKISATELTDAQWELLENAIIAQNSGYKKQKRSSQLITMTRTIGDYVDYEVHMRPDLTSQEYSVTIRANSIIKDDIFINPTGG